MLVDGQIDLLAGLAKTDGRLGIIGYPEYPMGSEAYNMLKHSEDDRITMDYSTLNGMRIGVLDSAIVQVLQKFLDSHGINAEVVAFPDHQSLILAFAWHRVDTMVAESDGSSEREDTTLLYSFGVSDYYLCVNKSRPDLLAALSRAQEQMALDEPNFVNSLKIKYDIVSRKLSNAEQAWLKEHDTLRVGYLNNYLPYSDTDESGNATGLVRDLVPQILEELGILRLDVSFTGYDSYDDMILDMNFGKIDVAFPVGGGLYFSEESGVYQSNPVASLGADLIYNEDSVNQTLQTFAVNKNNRIQYYYVRTHYPNAMIFYCSSIDECLAAVAEGKVPFTTVNGFRAVELLKNRKYRKLSLKPLNWPENHSFGVSLGNEGLLKILNRGVNVIGKDRLEMLANRHVDKLYSRSLYDMMMDHLWLIGLLIAAAALLAVAFFARESSHAKRRMMERERAGRELEEKNRELAENKQALIESNEKLAASAQREQAANVAKSQFLSNMSHEIRTPINAIMGMDEMIRREAEAPQIREYAENIRTASASLLSIVNDILDFSKIEAGKMEIIPVEYEISSVLNDLVNMLKTRAEKKGLTLDVEAAPDLPTLLYGDEIRIKQVATNVLTNAVKYTEKGGVTLRVSFEKMDGENIRLRFSVKDTGIGIKPEDIAKLFNAFERIEEKRNRTIEGTGLGMNITKKLLELMGSRLEVESVYGEGSTFSFAVEQGVVDWTPIGDFEQAFRRAVARQGAYHERFTAPEAKVLVVDDTKMNITV
ncbi:MAG: transporter substrate-binding domain-containing protein, partial [Schwartzia sp.]|nr:transporter substrate-binding domain-containing protein [Schwartzia sp. (in: firmicutes)]